MSCESYYLLKNHSKKVILCVCIGLTINNETFDCKTQDFYMKCKRDYSKLMTIKADLSTKVVRRNYVKFKNVKLCKT